MGVSIHCYSRIWDLGQDPIPGLIQTQDQGEVERRGKDDIMEATVCNFAVGLGEVCHIGILQYLCGVGAAPSFWKLTGYVKEIWFSSGVLLRH